MNAQQFFAWCNRLESRDRHFELERGKVVEVPGSGERHGFVCGSVGQLLSNYTFQQCKGYVLGNNTGVILERNPDTVCGPDVMLYDQTRRYKDLSVSYCERPPLLAVEVLSPDDKWTKVIRRICLYLSQGIAVVWVVDPEEQSVTVYRASQIPQVFEGQDELKGDPEMPGFHCRVADLFYMPGEEETSVPAVQG
jgi:Uma2 family endonuclease